jgi:hypothetical protein
VFTLEDSVREERLAVKWFNAPNRYDIRGVDYGGKRKLKLPRESDELPKMRGKAAKKKPEKSLLERLAELPF